MLKQDEYLVVSDVPDKKMKIRVTTVTYDSAIRAGKAILESALDAETVSVHDRKGNVLKIIKRGSGE